MANKINPNSKHQLKLKIKELKSDNDTLWNMAYRRQGALDKAGIMIGVRGDEFLMGNEERL